MLPDLHVPPHWPKMEPRAPCATYQDALRMLNRIRGMIIAYRFERKDWRFKHAQEDCLINVVAGLLADARAIDEHADSAEDDATRLALQVTKLTDDLAEAKRPFSAQMEMQNRRIIALTAELDRLKNDSGISDYVSK